jgi:hypothetical protein
MHFYPEASMILPQALETASEIIILTTNSFADFNRQVISRVDNVVAFDENDPLAILARSVGKNLWYPLTKKVITGGKNL